MEPPGQPARTFPANQSRSAPRSVGSRRCQIGPLTQTCLAWPRGSRRPTVLGPRNLVTSPNLAKAISRWRAGSTRGSTTSGFRLSSGKLQLVRPGPVGVGRPPVPSIAATVGKPDSRRPTPPAWNWHRGRKRPCTRSSRSIVSFPPGSTAGFFSWRRCFTGPMTPTVIPWLSSATGATGCIRRATPTSCTAIPRCATRWPPRATRWPTSSGGDTAIPTGPTLNCRTPRC